jgi:hypothetical protein
MKLTRSFTSFALIFSLSLISFLTLPVQTINAQDVRVALQRGYRTGYSDGYMAGYRDVIDNSAKNPARHSEYTKADRAYNKDYGLIEDYRDGYQQGFEVGYNTGYEKRSFDATLPNDLKKRGVVNTDTNATTTTPPTTTPNTEIPETKTPENTVSENTVPENTVSENTVSENTSTPTTEPQSPTIQTKNNEISYVPTNDAVLVIPTDTELILELIDELSTERNKEGDKFTAKIVSPMEMNGAIIEGKISKIQKPGRIKRRSEMLLTFDRIVLTEGRWGNFNAILTEVLPVKGDNVKRVDLEGTVEGKSSVKGDITKVGGSTGAGALIGVIAGGPVGAAVGAAVGAGFGVGAVVVERGKHIRLNKAQQLRIKSTYETQIR